MKKWLAGLFAFLFVFALSTHQASAASYTWGKSVITSEHKTAVFYAKAGEIINEHWNYVNDSEVIDIHVELRSANGELVQTRVGNAYNFVSHAESPYTVPEDGLYYFRFVNETPGTHWWLVYRVHN